MGVDEESRRLVRDLHAVDRLPLKEDADTRPDEPRARLPRSPAANAAMMLSSFSVN